VRGVTMDQGLMLERVKMASVLHRSGYSPPAFFEGDVSANDTYAASVKAESWSARFDAQAWWLARYEARDVRYWSGQTLDDADPSAITKRNLRERLNLSPEVAKHVYGLVKRSEDHEQTMVAIDIALDTCGVEVLRDEDDRDVWLSYCNTGDSYGTTIVFDHENETFRISSWADEVEARERRLDAEAEGEHREEIIEGMMSVLWGLSWADHVDEARCRSLSGCQIEDEMPAYPPECRALVEEVVAEIEKANSGTTLDTLYRHALRENANQGIYPTHKQSCPERFGDCLAYMARGDGVSWLDDNADPGINVPHCAERACDELRMIADERCEDCAEKRRKDEEAKKERERKRLVMKHPINRQRVRRGS